MAQHYYTVTWDQLHRDARALAWRLMARGPESSDWRGIVAVTRGGMIRPPSWRASWSADWSRACRCWRMTRRSRPAGDRQAAGGGRRRHRVSGGGRPGRHRCDDPRGAGAAATRALCLRLRQAGWAGFDRYGTSPRCRRTPGYCFRGTRNRSSWRRWRSAGRSGSAGQSRGAVDRMQRGADSMLSSTRSPLSMTSGLSGQLPSARRRRTSARRNTEETTTISCTLGMVV